MPIYIPNYTLLGVPKKWKVKMKNNNILVTGLLILLLLSQTAYAHGHSKTFNQEVQSLIGVLKLVDVEYKDAVKDRVIIDQGEYLETEIFLEKAVKQYEELEDEVAAKSKDTHIDVERRLKSIQKIVSEKDDPVKASGHIKEIISALSELSGGEYVSSDARGEVDQQQIADAELGGEQVIGGLRIGFIIESAEEFWAWDGNRLVEHSGEGDTHHLEIVLRERDTKRMIPYANIKLTVSSEDGSWREEKILKPLWGEFFHYAENFNFPGTGRYRAHAAITHGRLAHHDVDEWVKPISAEFSFTVEEEGGTVKPQLQVTPVTEGYTVGDSLDIAAAELRDEKQVDGYLIGFISEAVEEIYVHEKGKLKPTKTDEQTHHLEIVLRDAASRRMIPYANIIISLTNKDTGEIVSLTMKPIWGEFFHYASNAILSEGTWDINVAVNSPQSGYHDINDLFPEKATTTFTLEVKDPLKYVNAVSKTKSLLKEKKVSEAHSIYRSVLKEPTQNLTPETDARIEGAYVKAENALREGDSIEYAVQTQVIKKSLLKSAYENYALNLRMGDEEEASRWYQVLTWKFKWEEEEKNLDEILAAFTLKVKEEVVETQAALKEKDLGEAREKVVEGLTYYRVIEDDVRDKIGGEKEAELLHELEELYSAAGAGDSAKAEEASAEIEAVISIYETGSAGGIASKIKGISDLLQLVDQEYADAVKEGRIIDQGEYDEAKIFLDSARQKYGVIEDNVKKTHPREHEEIEVFFIQLNEKIDSKAEPSSVSPLVESLKDELNEVVGEEEEAEPAETGVESSVLRIKKQVQDSISEYKKGNNEKAASIARDAFILFEQELGKQISAVNPSLENEIESEILELSSLMKSGESISEIEEKVLEIYLGLDNAEKLLTQKVSPWILFLQSLTIIVREGFEAIIIISAIIAYLRVSGNQGKVKIIYNATALAVLASLLTAWLIEQVFHIGVASQEVLEGVTMLIAVVVLFYVSYWLVSKVQAEKWQQFIEGKVRDAITTGNQFILGSVAFLAVYREGFETVLFYKALFIGAPGGSSIITVGFVVGVFLLAVIFMVFYKYGVKIPVKQFFIATSLILYYMSFTFMGNGIAELQEGGAVSVTPASWAPDIPLLGMHATVETFVAQMMLIAAFIFSLVYVFMIQPERERKEAIKEVEHVEFDLQTLHNLVEDIQRHVSKCGKLSPESSKKEVKEAGEHIKEIDGKIHELLEHLKHMKEAHLEESFQYEEVVEKSIKP